MFTYEIVPLMQFELNNLPCIYVALFHKRFVHFVCVGIYNLELTVQTDSYLIIATYTTYGVAVNVFSHL